MDDEGFSAWLTAYFDAWRSNDPRDVEALFTEDAVYYVSPFKEPRRGRDAIVAAWVDDPSDQSEVQSRFEVLAVDGNVGIAHWWVSALYRVPPKRHETDGILLITFDEQGRCTDHREWFDMKEAPV
jgi:uncharacterized protein (TIGR02246 family)